MNVLDTKYSQAIGHASAEATLFSGEYVDVGGRSACMYAVMHDNTATFIERVLCSAVNEVCMIYLNYGFLGLGIVVDRRRMRYSNPNVELLQPPFDETFLNSPNCQSKQSCKSFNTDMLCVVEDELTTQSDSS